MPNYNYLCKDCLQLLAGQHPNTELTIEQIMGADDKPGAVFETYHSMNPSPEELAKAMVCPMCQGSNTEKTMLGTDQTFFMKGYGWLDKPGIKRDMNHFKLTNEDPYKEHRVSGEADDLATRLRRGPQKKPMVFDTNPKDASS